jgi:Flp pilus assembly protein TadD
MSRKPAPKPRLPVWVIALLVGASAIAYANALDGPFIFDDSSSVLDNRTITDLSDPVQVLRPPFETPVAGRPLVNLSFALNFAAGGYAVAGYHAVNVLLHTLCGLLLFGIVRRTLKELTPQVSLAIALVWLVHPLNTEAVNYVTQRTELLMALFLLLTLYAAIRAVESKRSPWTIVSVTACALGMGAKETMVVAPLLVIAYDRIFLFTSWKSAWSARARLYAALAAAWIVLIWLGAGSGRALSAGFTAHDSNPWVYLLNQAQIIARYVRLAFWPSGLAIDYGVPRPLTFADVWPYALALSSLAVLTVVALIKWPRAGFLGLWFFLTLAPTSSVLPIPTEVGAERRMYLPLMAIVTLVLAELVRRLKSPQRVMAVTAILCVILVPVTWARNQEYKSALTLTETTVARYPTGAAETMYGTELAAAGRLMEAEMHLRRGVSSYPPAHFYLATVLSAQGKTDEALLEFAVFIRTQPPTLAQVKTAHLLSADLHARAGRWDAAAQQYREILTNYPGDATAETRLADAFVRLSRYPEAIALFQKLIKASPGDPSLINGLGVALISSGRVDEAIAAFQRVIELDPNHPGAARNLSLAMAMRGR